MERAHKAWVLRKADAPKDVTPEVEIPRANGKAVCHPAVVEAGNRAKVPAGLKAKAKYLEMGRSNVRLHSKNELRDKRMISLSSEIKKIPAIPGITMGILAAAVLGIIFQGNNFGDILSASFAGYSSNAGVEAVDNLLTKGGFDIDMGIEMARNLGVKPVFIDTK